MIKPILKEGYFDKEITRFTTNAIYTASIGTENDEGSDIFFFYVYTPDQFAFIFPRDDFFFGKNCLFLNEISNEVTEKAINSILAAIDGKDWEDVAQKISRYGSWEFEDYKPCVGLV